MSASAFGAAWLRAARRAFAAVAIAAAAACAGSAAPRPVAPATDAASIELYARLLTATDARRTDTALLDSAIGSRWPALRAAGALAVGQLHASARAARLRSLLSEGDTAVAAAAGFALGLMRDSASVEQLAAALASDAPVAAEAAWSLGEIGAPARARIVDALRATPSGADPRPVVNARALPALLVAAAKLRPLPADAIAPFASSIRAQSIDVTRAASYALARSRSPAGVRPLLALASMADGEVRESVARGIARAAAGDSLADRALAALAVLAADTSAHVRVNAARSLGTYGPAARTALVAMLRDPDANVRVAVAQSLAGVLGPVPEDWRAAWDADTGYMYRRSLLASAVATGVTLDAIDAANRSAWQRHADWRYRAAVADAAAAAKRFARLTELAVPLTRDADGRVRAAAYGAIAAWADSSVFATRPLMRDSLLLALRDRDFGVRAVVLAALAARARATEVPAVLASYRMAATDTANDARVAAVRYLAAAWRLDSVRFDSSSAAAVRALPSPRDPLEHQEGKGISTFAAWSPPAGSAHPAAWYESVVREVVLPSLAGRWPRAEMVTQRGTITLELFGDDAPLTVLNFVTLARRGYLSDTRFHRVVPNFVAQDGDPRGDGNGGPGYAIRDELNRRRYERGAVGMALSGPDTGGSQYFLTLSPQPHLDGHYTVFGRVVAGAEVMDRLVQGDRIISVRPL